LRHKADNQANTTNSKVSYICDLKQQYQILHLQSPGVNCASMTSLGQSNKEFRKFSAIQ